MEKRLKNLGNRNWKKKRKFSWELPREFIAKLLYR